MGELSTRHLGEQGLEVSALGMGCMGLSTLYGADTAGSDPERVIHAAIDRGITLFDTADSYGDSEEVMGRALRPHRDKVTIATKFGINLGANPPRISGDRAYVRQACEASLQRLGTDHIDLYIQHRLDPDTPIEETVGALGELVGEGKIRFIALCEVGPATIRRAHAVHPLSAVHAEYSLWARDPEARVLPVVRDLGLGFIPYSPLGRGFLSGTIRSTEDLAPDDWRRTNPRFMGDNFVKNLELLDRVVEIAKRKGCSTAQLALAWILAVGRSIVPLQGATDTEQLAENVAATELSLSEADMAAIEVAAPFGAGAGEAYTPGTIAANLETD